MDASHTTRRAGLLPTLLLLGSALTGDAARAGEGGAASTRRWISLRFPGLEWVETERLAEALNDEAASPPLLLDARAEAEFDVSHLRGARRIDPGSEPSELAGLPRDRPIVVYCSIGYRSAALARRLSRAGFARVANLEGGIFQWANEGRPVYRDGERVEEVHPYDALWGRLLDARLHPPR